MDGAGLRAVMPALANKTYFNYGGQGPLPTPSLEAIVDTWRRIQELGPFTEDVWPLLGGLSGALRSRLAQWFGVSPARVAFTENVTSGCVLPLWGLPWSEGEEILLGDAEHPGVVAACQELARREGLTITPEPRLEERSGWSPNCSPKNRRKSGSFRSGCRGVRTSLLVKIFTTEGVAFRTASL